MSKGVLKKIVICLLVAAPAIHAQPAPLPTVITPSVTVLTPAQLNQLLAPIALYPDPLLASILAAATYPAQVVEAQRFLADPANASLDVTQLTNAAASHGWDPSVLALLAFPQVLQMMDANLEWTEHLGQAFAAQQADVMGAVQNLRRLAQQAGSLASGPGDAVSEDGGNIVINPPSPQDVAVPSYDPACVYGGEAACSAGQDQVGWFGDYALPYGAPFWGNFDWAGRSIRLARFHRDDAYGRPGGPGRGDGVWHHTALRGGGAHVALGETAGGVRAYNYALPANASFAARGGFRATPGFSARPAVPPRPAGTFIRAPVARVAAPARVAPAIHATAPAGHR